MKLSEINKHGREVLSKYKQILKSNNKEDWKDVIEMIRAKIDEFEFEINNNCLNPEIAETIKLKNIYKSALYQIINKFGKKFILPKFKKYEN